MYITGCLHIVEDIVLKLWNRLERVRNILILLDVAYHLGGLSTLSEIDQVSTLDDGRNSVFDKGQVREIYT